MSDFTKHNIDEYLKKLAKRFRKLNGSKIPAEIILVGGASVLINYGFREKSNDIDAIIQASSAMKDAINQIRHEENLPQDWINSDFTRTSSYSPSLRIYSKHYRTFSNIVEIRTVSGEYLIAMKLMSGRKYKNDLSDVIGILKEESNAGNNISMEQIRDAAKNLYGSYGALPDVSKVFIEKLMDRLEKDDESDIYTEFVEQEKGNKASLIEFESEYPDVLNEDNISDILSMSSVSLRRPSAKSSLRQSHTATGVISSTALSSRHPFESINTYEAFISGSTTTSRLAVSTPASFPSSLSFSLFFSLFLSTNSSNSSSET